MSGDRLLDSITRIVKALVPKVTPFGTWQYRVQNTAFRASPWGVTIDAIPAGASPYGPISGIVLWPGPDGSVAVPAVGSLVRLAFAEGNPGMPMIVGLDPDQAPTMVYLGNAPGLAAARQTDAVACTGVSAGVPTGIIVTAPSGGGPCVLSTGSGPTAYKLTGTITGGSSAVQST